LLDLLGSSFDLRSIRHISWYNQCLPASPLYILPRAFQPIAPACQQSDMGTLTRKSSHCGAPHACRGARNDNNFGFLYLLHHISFLAVFLHLHIFTNYVL
jgi:hypothetical protein